jgi:hypothetical protein
MSTESPNAHVKPLRLSEGQTEMLMKALMAESQIESPNGLTDTQFIRLRLDSTSKPKATPAPSNPKNMVL